MRSIPAGLCRVLGSLQAGLADHLGLIADRLSPTRDAEAEAEHTQQLPPSSIRFETFVLRLRIGAMVVAAAAVPLMGVDNLFTMYAVVGFFGLYTLLIARFLIPLKPSWLARGYLNFTVDSGLLAVAIGLTGGIYSPFMAAYLPVLAVHSFRYGAMQFLYGPVVSMLSIALGTLLAAPTRDALARMLFWDFWVIVLVLAVTLLAERSRRAESRLAMELERTRRLLEAAHAPAASLTVDGVLTAILTQARQLTGADVAAVQLHAARRQPIVYREEADDGPGVPSLRRLVRSDFRARQLLVSSGRPLAPAELAEASTRTDGSLSAFTSLCAASIPGPNADLGFVTVAKREPPPLGAVDFDALSAFLGRAALAIQNARLYEQVQAQLHELRTLHSRMLRVDRLAALGELAAKVTHELNNPLGTIMLYNSLLAEGPVAPEEQQRIAEAVTEQVERARRVVREVLDYSYLRQPEVETIFVHEVVEDALHLVRHAANIAGVRIIERHADRTVPVMADHTQLAQVFMNMMLNAVHAMPKGGTLTIETGLEQEEVFARFIDTGTGILSEHLSQIFEPFFTTKEPQQGTGLGLAVARTIVAQHRGKITVESQVDRGSVFTVWLPLSPIEEEAIVR